MASNQQQNVIDAGKLYLAETDASKREKLKGKINTEYSKYCESMLRSGHRPKLLKEILGWAP